MPQISRTIAICVLTSLSVVSTTRTASAETFVYDFATGLDGWRYEWHKESETGTDGVVAHSTARGYNDAASLHFDMGDGFGDDGTLWIEKQFAVTPGVPTDVAVSFQLFNSFESHVNTFQVKAAIGPDDPDVQLDFTTIGSTDSAEGWVPFEYSQRVTSPIDHVWVALGIRVAWEVHRDYWIDQVTVETRSIPEPTTACLLVSAAGTFCLLARRERNRERSCRKPATFLAARE